MAGPINLVPWGLANFLGLKGGESGFRAVSDGISLSIDIMEFLAAPNARESIFQGGNIAALGVATYAALVVPQGECWLVRGANFSATTLVGEVFRGYLALIDQNNRPMRAVTPESAASLTDAAGIGQAHASMNLPPFIMLPGDFLGTVVNRITTAASIATVAGASIYRFKS